MPLSRIREVMELAWRDPGTGVSRATNMVATFAEAMDPATLSNSTFKLYKGTTQITNVTVTPSADGTSRTLGSWSLYILCFEHA
jgi:hypothetical protein